MFQGHVSVGTVLNWNTIYVKIQAAATAKDFNAEGELSNLKCKA
jgi:hypothetical protein